MENDELIQADEWIPILLETLKEGKIAKISPNGYSMYPLLVGGRDDVFLKLSEDALKVGDVVLYRRKSGKHVLHRIYRIVGTEYYMLGDYQTEIEGPLKREQILAVAESFERKGKKIFCDNKKYKIYVKVWNYIRPLRPILIKMWRGIRIIMRKQKKEIMEE